MNKQIIILLVLLCLPLVYCTCDVYNLSLALCNSEINCVKRMFLDENVGDNVTFNFLLNRVITDYRVNTFLDVLICNSTEAQAMWMVILKSFSFCEHVNEYFSAHLQRCVCRPDKVCGHKDAKGHFFIFSGTQVFAWALLVILCVAIIPISQEFANLNRNYIAIKKILGI